jgi:signal transduction histidine kinase
VTVTAARATAADGPVATALPDGVTPDDLLVSVSDTGIGIAAADHERIFQSFQQIDSSSSRQYPGTGLGLALVRQLVTLHDGRVWLESAPGAGSTFYVLFPLALRGAS